jgi:hypothetical protein
MFLQGHPKPSHRRSVFGFRPNSPLPTRICERIAPRPPSPRTHYPTNLHHLLCRSHHPFPSALPKPSPLVLISFFFSVIVVLSHIGSIIQCYSCTSCRQYIRNYKNNQYFVSGELRNILDCDCAPHDQIQTDPDVVHLLKLRSGCGSFLSSLLPPFIIYL